MRRRSRSRNPANLTRYSRGETFTYDATGQQARATVVTNGTVTADLHHVYDGDRFRVKKVENSVATYYVRSSVLGGQVVGEIDKDGAWRRGYVYDGGGGLLAVQQAASVHFVHQDPLTKSQAVTMMGGTPHPTVIDTDPWGGETKRSHEQGWLAQRFTSYHRDDASASPTHNGDDAQQRRYHSAWSRFDQPDPYDGSMDITNPQSFNRYAYVNNDPVNHVDPSGMLPNWLGSFLGRLGDFFSGGGGDDVIRVYTNERGRQGGEGVAWTGGRNGRRAIVGKSGAEGGGGRTTTPQKPVAPQQPEPNDCLNFADIVARIAADYTNLRDALYERFNNRDRPGFRYEEFRSRGFRSEFNDDRGSFNQVYHYVGAFRAGYTLGGRLGGMVMDHHENDGADIGKEGITVSVPINRGLHAADRALNQVAVRHGALVGNGNIKPNQLADAIRREVCR